MEAIGSTVLSTAVANSRRTITSDRLADTYKLVLRVIRENKALRCNQGGAKADNHSNMLLLFLLQIRQAERGQGKERKRIEYIQKHAYSREADPDIQYIWKAQGKETAAQNDLENSQRFLESRDHGIPWRSFQEQKYRADNQDNADNLKRNFQRKASFVTSDKCRFAAGIHSDQNIRFR